MARNPEKYARASIAITDAEGPVLVPCAGGRHRTGLICSLLLSLTGAEPTAIAENYERGFRGEAAHRGHETVYDPAQGGWVHDQPEHEWRASELDEAMVQLIPVLLQSIDSTSTS